MNDNNPENNENIPPPLNNNNEQNYIAGYSRNGNSRSSGISRSRRQREYSQFHINQFYEAAEDEQLYTDEYLCFAHDYNRFVANSNIMFSRIEQGLRSNISRSITREYFYYNRHNELTRNTVPSVSSNYNDAPAPSAPQAPPSAPAPSAHPSAHPSAPPASERNVSDNNMFSRVILDYMNSVLNRRSRDDLSYNPMPQEPAPQQQQQQQQEPIRPQPNLAAQPTRAQPYAVFFDLTSENDGSITNNNINPNANNILNRLFNDRNTNIPTARQLQAGTVNTRFSNIITPTNSICPISHDEFIDTSDITQIRGCSHIFNRSSLSEWFRTHSTCPMCRYDIRDYRENTSSPLNRMRTQTTATASASSGSRNNNINNNNINNNNINNNNNNNNSSNLQRPDLGAIQSIVDIGANINDIYNRIMDNSGNFINANIENMNENMITFSYDLPGSYRNDDDGGDDDYDYGNGGEGGDIEEVD